MAEAKNGARFVRCPKCMKVIVEFASIPVYQCGGCKTTLRAKHHVPTEQNGATQIPEKNSGKTQSSDSVTNELSPHPQEKANDSSQLRNLDISQPISTSNSEGKVSTPTSAQVTTVTKSHQAGDTESKADDNLNVEVKKNLQPCEQAPKSLKSSEGLQEPAELSSTDVSSNFGKNSRSNELDYSPNSTYRDSTDYDHRLSSSVDGCDDCFGGIQTPLMVKSPSRGVAQDSTDTKVEKAEATELANSEKANASKLTAQDPSTNSFHKRNSSTNMGRFVEHIDVLPTMRRSHRRQSTSLDSEDFYSIYNWFEPEKKGALRSLAKDAMLLNDSLKLQPGTPTSSEYVDQIRMKIMKKVDDLKNEINDLFGEFKQDDEKPFQRQSQQRNNHNRRISDLVNNSGVFASGTSSGEQHKLVQDHCYLHSRVNEYDKYLKHSSSICPCHNPYSRYMPVCMHCRPNCAATQPLYLSSGLGLHCHVAQKHEEELERLRRKERRQSEKRHLRPVLGGAPFVICNNCLKLLQLPVDFSATRKKLYKLQCSACSQVLLFSFGTKNRVFYQSSSEVNLPTKVDSNISMKRNQ